MDTAILKKKIKLAYSFLSKPFKIYLTSPYRRKIVRYNRYYKHLPIKKHTILYESFYGRGMLCCPYALFKELIRHPKYKNYHHVWVLDDLDGHADLIREYRNTPLKISFVQHESRKYLKYLASAKYLINNVSFYNYFIKKRGQIYINTWHGIPLKHLGYDEPTGALTASNMARNFLHTDYLISANPFLTEIYKHAFKQEGLSNVQIIEEGYPRLDTLVHTEAAKVYTMLRQKGVSVDPGKEIILYAPTWRGNSYANPNCNLDELIQFKDTLENIIDTNKYQILIKVHQVVYSKIKEQLDEFSYVVPATMDANVILSVTDILISDFSSIYFDFLVTGKPVLFYITDLEKYSDVRGIYCGIDSLPGPNTDSMEVLGGWINHIAAVFEENRERYQEVREWCCNYDVGRISEKIIRTVFEKNAEGVRMLDCGNGKEKLLISRGRMLVNGISTSLINLLNQIDYDRYDVTVLLEPPKNQQQKDLVLRIHPKARVMIRSGMMLRGLTEDIRNNFYTQSNPIRHFTEWIFPKKTYQREFRRIWGESEFDYVIDFDGYNNFHSSLCLIPEAKQVCIWLHNDMLSEFNLKYNWLKKTFYLYHKFDSIVSCSRQVMEVNRQNLSDYAEPDKFLYAKNCIDFERINSGVREGKLFYYNGKYHYIETNENNLIIQMKLIPLQPGNMGLADSPKTDIAPAGTKISDGITRFVTIGRLSVEKNQAALISAFARLEKRKPDIMLFLIGEGPARKELRTLINDLGLADKIILTGNLSNPFGLLNQCDCFVLPSIHEGQPLVVFEARALHMPIILSKFSSVAGSMIERGQYLVQTDEASIYDGLCAYMAGDVPSDYDFVPEKYNDEAYLEFQAAVFGK